MAVHVLFGSDHNVKSLELLAASNGTDLWTLPASASSGDTVVFYIKSPTSSFVATGRVLGDRREPGARHGWPGQSMGDVGRIRTLKSPVRLRDAAAAVPGWGYLTQPHTNTTVPSVHEQTFLAALGTRTRALPAVPTTALENVRREATVLGRSRNRRLRDEVVAASRGVCAACATDYAAVEPSRWNGLLQAHHKKPLHLLEGTVVNLASDLVALCPTCHVLCHLPKGKARTAAQVRALLRKT